MGDGLETQLQMLGRLRTNLASGIEEEVDLWRSGGDLWGFDGDLWRSNGDLFRSGGDLWRFIVI